MSYHDLSPKARKAVEAGAARQREWWPRLQRTRDKLVLKHARRNRRGQRQSTAWVMTQELGWSWDSKAGYFYTDLTADNLKAVLNAWSDYGRLFLIVSDGVRQYQADLKDTALPVEPASRGRAKLFKS